MRSSVAAAALALLATATHAGSLPAALWPAPRSATCTGGAGGSIASEVRISLAGAGATSDVATTATARYLPLFAKHAVAGGSVRELAVTVASSDETLGQDTDYSYSIKLGDGMQPVIAAASPFGVAYALETLSQFIEESTGKLHCAQISVADAPTFLHRGIMIDTGRRFYPVPLVLMTIEGMAMTKQNVLHFHLSEECFRVHSATYPQLTASCVEGANNNTAAYSREDIATIVEYARLRGVRVLPEFDMVRSACASPFPLW